MLSEGYCDIQTKAYENQIRKTTADIRTCLTQHLVFG